MVVFGRPKGARGAYIQHQEGGIAPQVVFEVLSKGNTISEMARKFDFYQTYGVAEYYVYDHMANDLAGWVRSSESGSDRLEPIVNIQNWQSPLLGIRFELTDDNLNILKLDHTKFLTYLEQADRADAERRAKEQALESMSKFAAKLREMGLDPNNL
jgi:Uma2 family endonuclease